MKHRIICFTKYTRAGASSRYRIYQYLPVLEAAGLSLSISTLFDSDYLTYKYAHGHASIRYVLRAFARRLWAVLTVPREAVVVIEKELLPWFPAVLERWLAWRGCRMMVDYDDAIFHQYDAHRNPWVRRLLGRKIATVMRLSHTVVAGNAYLADYACRVGASRVVVIATVVDLARYAVKDTARISKVFTIGWIGSPSTARYLHAIAPALAQVCQGDRARVRLVGSEPVELPGVPVDVIAWSEETEVDEIRGFDVGIMPLSDELWEHGKCGFKLIQYMACCLPVVASPVGVNTTIVEHGFNGFLATSAEEWAQALCTLAADSALRHRMGQAGRAKVDRGYSLQISAPRLTALLQEVTDNKGG
jgi:glycosyltransferase involved in cell wall biosynthesis